MAEHGSGVTGIDPAPPLGDTPLPWDAAVDDPVGALRRIRGVLGDTFAVVSGNRSYLFVFSATGVDAFYNLAEADASKAIADWRMLRRKVPDELFAGRRTLPGEVFGRRESAEYLGRVDEALVRECADLGTEGRVDVFDLTRRLGHRIGLSCWGPPGVLDQRFDELVEVLDRLDGSAAFVTPREMLATALADRADERVALERAEQILVETMKNRPVGDGVFASIAGRWNDEPEEVRQSGIALDVVLLHLGSMSNLFAAVGWALIDVLAEPDRAVEIRAGDDTMLEACCLESIRLAQRSIMMREVQRPIEVDAGDRIYRVEPGVTIATLLPLTNTTAAPGFEDYRPERWNRRRLAAGEQLASRTLVTTFGHGEHTCPAQPFSLLAMTRALRHLLLHYEFTAEFTAPAPLRGQIGGVARANDPCIVGYHRRPDSTSSPVQSY